MTNPVKNILIQKPQTIENSAEQEVFNSLDLTCHIFQQYQGRTFSLINKISNVSSQYIIESSFKQLQQALTRKDLQKRHPTLSSFIQSNQISNHQQLVAHLRKEAYDLDLTETTEFKAFRTSTAPKYLLALDALIEQTNFTRANRDNYLWALLGGIELSRNYETWNGAVQIIDARGITTLSLVGCKLTRIPHGVYQLNNLQELWLFNNQLAALPPQIGELQNLQLLYLNNNQLTALPPQIGLLLNLQTLWLKENQLTTLPLQVGELQKLKHLSIGSNQLDTLPESFSAFKAQLDIAGDKIRELILKGKTKKQEEQKC